MPTCSKSLVIFILFAVLWLELKAHICGFRREKTHKKFGKATTSSKTSTAATTSTSTPAKIIKCNTGTVPSCKCDLSNYDSNNYPDGFYYPVPKSGNCTDVFKRSSTTPSDFHFSEENCHKVQRTVCRVDSYCWDASGPDDSILPTPDSFIMGQNASAPFCQCCCRPDYVSDYNSMPKSGNCNDLLETTYNYSVGCYKEQTFCSDTCHCNDLYVDPTGCNPQTCNNASEPFCMCAYEDDGNYYKNYPMLESGNCMDYLKLFSTTPAYSYRSGPPCYKARKVCRCAPTFYNQTAHCACNDECVAGCESWVI